MKSSVITVLGLLLCGPLAYSQQDSTTSEPHPGSPQGQYGTQRIPDQIGEMKEDRVEVKRDQLPPPMVEELEANPIYEGWENGNFFFERNTNQFHLHVIRDNSTHTYRFDNEGIPIKTDAPVNLPETKQ